MKTYSVKQIADMLDTNPETVRRWIRDKKLDAVQVSRKDGNIVTEDELQRFLKATPKYAPRFAASMVAIPNVGLPIALATLLYGKIAGYYDEKKMFDFGILPEDILKYLRENIKLLEESISHKSKNIKQLEHEIIKEKQELHQLKYLLEHGDFNMLAGNKKK